MSLLGLGLFKSVSTTDYVLNDMEGKDHINDQRKWKTKTSQQDIELVATRFLRNSKKENSMATAGLDHIMIQ